MSSQNGQLTFNFALSVPADKTEAVEEVIATHAAWMRETHSLEADGRIHLVDYHVAKAEEMNNLLDPSEGKTGNILYSINEVYVEKDGIDQIYGESNAMGAHSGFRRYADGIWKSSHRRWNGNSFYELISTGVY